MRNAPAVVGIECSEHVLAEAFGGTAREEVFVHFDELIFGEVALRAVLLQRTVVLETSFEEYSRRKNYVS